MAMANAFAAFEARFGSIGELLMKAEHAKVLEVSSLTREAMQRLVNHETPAVRVPGWFSEGGEGSAAHTAASNILSESDVRNWRVARGVSRLDSDSTADDEESEVVAVGLPHNVALASGQEAKYFEEAIHYTRRWRYTVGQDRSKGSVPTNHFVMGPLDKLRLEMDEIWPDGCMIMKKNGQPYAPGIPRLMKPAKRYDPTRWTRGFAHVDALEVMSNSRGVYSANIYLRNSQCGGEVLIWPISYTSRWQFFRNAYTLSMCLSQDSASQAYLRERLPPPISIHVNEGDLLILCTQRPHAVNGPIAGGTRVSMQAFMQYESGKPLFLGT